MLGKRKQYQVEPVTLPGLLADFGIKLCDDLWNEVFAFADIYFEDDQFVVAQSCILQSSKHGVHLDLPTVPRHHSDYLIPNITKAFPADMFPPHSTVRWSLLFVSLV
jgi:hypothetical protein